MPWSARAQYLPQNFTVEGRLYDASGAPLNETSVDIQLELLVDNPTDDPTATCVVYREVHSGINVAPAGLFSRRLGTGTLTYPAVRPVLTTLFSPGTFNGNSDGGTGDTCSVAAAASDHRFVRVSVHTSAITGYEVLKPDTRITAVPQALYAESAHSVEGFGTGSLILQNTGGTKVLTQQNLETVFSTPRFTTLLSLLNGTAPASFGNQRLTGVGSPVSSTDAATKGYSDSFLGGSTLDVTSVGTAAGNGATLIWDQAHDKWTTGIPTLSGSAGGDLTGTYPNPSIAAGAITNTKIATGAVGSTQLAADSVTPAKINSTGIGPGQLVMTDATGSTFVYATCNSNEIMRWTASGWACTTVAALAPVASVNGRTGAITLTTGDITGLGLAALLDYGTSALQLVQLDGSTKLPAVDGSQLTNVNATYLSSRSVASTPPSGGQVLAWNGSSTQWEPSTVASSGTLTGDVSGPTGATVVNTVGGSTAALVHSAEITANAGTSANTAGTFVKRDANGSFSAGTASLAVTTLRGSTSGLVNMQSPATVTSYTLTWPSDAGLTNQVLTTDGAGNLSWTTASSGTSGGSLAGDVTGPENATVVSSVGGSTAALVHSAEITANAGTSANTAGTLVMRDAGGGFSAGTASFAMETLRGSAGGFLNIKMPAAVVSYTLTWPAVVGGNNQILTTDNAGNLSWTTPTAASTVAVSAPITNSGSTTAANLAITQATTSTDGYLSSTDWNTFNNKQSTALNSAQVWVGNGSNIAIARTLSGDLTMSNAGAASVVALSGVGINSVPATTGQVLRFTGTKFDGQFLNLGDIHSSVTPALTAFPGTPCTASQTLTWSSLTDTLSCTNISVAGFSGSLAGDVTGTQGATVVSTIGGSTAALVHSAEVTANAGTSANTSGTLIKRDAGGNFSASNASLASETLRGSTSGSLSMQAPATVTSYTLTWPTAVGSNAQVLTTDNTGNLSWATPLPPSTIVVNAPLTNSGGTTAANISITQATTSSNGYLSSSDWNTFNNKQSTALNSAQVWVGSSGNVATARTLAGDVSLGNTGVANVGGINGVSVSSNPVAAGQVLRYTGTNYTGSYLNLGDIHSSITTALTAFPSTPCTNGQTLTWSSLTDTLTCSNLAVAPSNFSLQTANTVLVATSGTAGQPSFRSLLTADLPSTVAYNGGNAVAANMTLGSTSLYNLTLIAGNTPLMTFTPGGKIGIGGPPTALLDVEEGTAPAATNGGDIIFNGQAGGSGNQNGGNILLSAGTATGTGTPGTIYLVGPTSINGMVLKASQAASAAVDFNKGNMAYNTGNCGAFTLSNMKDGGTYTLVIQGTTSATCSFTAYSGNLTGQYTNVFMPPDHTVTTSGKRTLYTFVVIGGDVYVSWVPGM